MAEAIEDTVKLVPPASINLPLVRPLPPSPRDAASLLRALPLLAALAGGTAALTLWLPGVWGLLWLGAAVAAGAMLVRRFFPDLPAPAALAGAYLSGLVVCALASFVAALALAPFTERAVPAGGVLVALLVILVAVRRRAHRDLVWLRPAPLELALLLVALLFSLWLYDRSLSYDERAGEITF